MKSSSTVDGGSIHFHMFFSPTPDHAAIDLESQTQCKVGGELVRPLLQAAEQRSMPKCQAFLALIDVERGMTSPTRGERRDAQECLRRPPDGL